MDMGEALECVGEAVGGDRDDSRAEKKELGVCVACGTVLHTRRVCFARCGSCEAENYRPADDLTVEERVARFWRRRMQLTVASVRHVT